MRKRTSKPASSVASSTDTMGSADIVLAAYMGCGGDIVVGLDQLSWWFWFNDDDDDRDDDLDDLDVVEEGKSNWIGGKMTPGNAYADMMDGWMDECCLSCCLVFDALFVGSHDALDGSFFSRQSCCSQQPRV